MQWILPGTVLRANAEDADHVESLFQPMFLAGGMVLSQVSSITGLEPYIIQNWVKRGFLTPPQCKRYTLRRFLRQEPHHPSGVGGRVNANAEI